MPVRVVCVLEVIHINEHDRARQWWCLEELIVAVPVEQFGECVEICLNKAHRNFKYIDKNSSAFNEQLLSEIMAAALMARNRKNYKGYSFKKYVLSRYDP